MALKIAILSDVAQADGSTKLAGAVYEVARDVGFATTIAAFLDIEAEYTNSLSGWGILEIPVDRLLGLEIDVRANRLAHVELDVHGWSVDDLAEAQVAARAPGVRILIQS